MGIMSIITRKIILIFIHISCLSVMLSAQSVERVYSIDTDSIKRISDDVRNGIYGKISSIIILSKSHILYEQYFGFNNSTTLHPISSVTKSVTSLVTGICIDKGFLKTIDTPIWKFFPEFKSIFDSDTIKKTITIRNLLNQTTGLAWDEWTSHYSDAVNALI